MTWIEKLKLYYRANKYKTKDDTAGIAYVLEALNKGDTALDIGAHKAGYLYHIRTQVGAHGSIFALEPQTVLYQYLQNIIHIFEWKNVSAHQLALSDAQGIVKLLLPVNAKQKASSPGATIAQLDNGVTFTESEAIATDTLDNFCAAHNIKPNFLKIDVEGNELKVFKGGIKTLKEHKPKIMVEIEARHIGKAQAQETFSFLTNLGYNGFALLHNGKIPLSEFSFEAHQNPANNKNYCNNFAFE
jgi:FkbM family methyltransferase